jgi:DNA-binding LacI/PurR family transcriptional regulator
MSTDEILIEIKALWGPSGATVKGVARSSRVAHTTVRRALRGEGRTSHPVAVAILAAVKAL